MGRRTRQDRTTVAANSATMARHLAVAALGRRGHSTRSILVVASALGLAAAAAAAPARTSRAPVLLVCRGACEYPALLAQLEVPYCRTASLDTLAALEPGQVSAVIVCALGYPRATPLRPAEQRALERFVRHGGCALVEMAVGRPGPLFGVPMHAVFRHAFFERLFVVAPHPVTAALGPEALLEEHNSAYLPCSPPPGARILLAYGKVLGTYRVYHRPHAGVEMVLDLGQPRPIARIVQRYGARQPDYCPEQVDVAVSSDGRQWRPLFTQRGAPLLAEVLDVPVSGPPAHLVRFRLTKFPRSATTDFLFVGETQVLDPAGRNLALGMPYRLTPAPAYADSGGLLTDGVTEGHWSDHLSVGWSTQPPRDARRVPGLIEVRFGRGRALIALTKLSDFRARHYRLTSRWETLLRETALHLLPGPMQQAARRRYLPLTAHTEPRRWQVPGRPVRLLVTTSPDARVRVTCPGLRLPRLESMGGGRWSAWLSLPVGHHLLKAVASTGSASRAATVPIEVSPRRSRYRRTLEQNMRWFRRSGVLRAADGSRGVYSQRCMAWLDGAPWDGGPGDALPSPFRFDCQAATFIAFWLYGEVTGDPTYRSIARRIADNMLGRQLLDASRPSFGGWPWLFTGSDALYFWDDETRTAVSLLRLYTRTGDARYLEAGLRTMELCRGVAQEDACIARHAIGAGELNAIGRAAYRQFRHGLFVDFDLLRWFWAAGVTGDSEYDQIARTCARTRGHQAGLRAIPFGLPIAVHATGDRALRARLLEAWQAYLNHPDVRRWGVRRVGGHDFQYAFVNDCSIGTEPQEPLTDQLYSVPHELLGAWAAYKATGDPSCLRAFQGIADYLVRIQCQDPDPRLNGAWMRGFDLEAWEEYGAPYDPYYGPYSAYTGWMNAFVSEGLSLYLLDQTPFPPRGLAGEQERAVLRRVRCQEPPDRAGRQNIGRHRPYTLSPEPAGAYRDDGRKLTDGVVDGHYSDGLSVGWHLDESAPTLTVTTTVDLEEERAVALVAQRYGGTVPTYGPDHVAVALSRDGLAFESAAEVRAGSSEVGSVWIPLPSPVRARFIRIVATKYRRSAATDFLFVGETMAFAAQERWPHASGLTPF